MRIGLTIGPTADWTAVMALVQVADVGGIEAVGFWDHYHAERPEWGMICGWSAYGALAMATKRIRFVPMVIDRMNYLPGVLAKETAILSLISGGRFELGIGAGDYFKENRAWGIPVPDPQTRIGGLKETILALRQIWRGELVSYEGEQIRLKDACCTPIPPVPPRVVVGVGSSRRLLQSAIAYADEINVYADDELIRFAHQEIEESQRSISLSVFMGESLPANLAEKLATWETLGVERTFITLWHPFDQIVNLVKLV